MASGTIYGTTTNEYITAKLVWTEIPDAANNRSDVDVSFYLKKSTQSTAHTTGSGYFWLKFLGGNYHWDHSIDIENDGQWHLKKIWHFTNLSHDSNGALSIPMSFYNSGDHSGLPSTSYTDTYLSGTAVLDTFTLGPFDIVAGATGGGSILPAGTTSVPAGNSQSFVITPSEGFHVDTVLVDGAPIGAVSSYTFTDVVAPHTIDAYFAADAENSHIIILAAGSGGTITGPTNVVNGATASYEVSADTGYEIGDVQVDGVSIGALSAFDLVNVVANHTIVVIFVVVGSPPADPDPPVTGVSFTSEHTVHADGYLTKARYAVVYTDGLTRTAHVHVYKGTVETGELIFEGDVASGADIVLNEAVVFTPAPDVINMVVTTAAPIVGGEWDTDFFESKDDNTWTFLGYADDQLVGMTANHQIWNGALGTYKLANAKTLLDPTGLSVTGNLTPVGDITLSAEATGTETHRVTLSHTLLNQFGPTLPSATLTFYASKPTIEWTSANYVKVHGSVANIVDDVSAGIVAVELYFSEDELKEPALLGRMNLPDITEGTPPPETKDWSFNWVGYLVDTSMWTVANLTVPDQNYTTGVPASRMVAIDGQLYFWGNEDFPYRIWVGGNPGNRFSVSPGTGGGFVDVEPGIGTEVTDVLKFKTQQGAAIVTSLCDNPNSQKENRYNLVESNLALSDTQSIKGWMAEKIAGAVGCKSSRGALVAGDGLYAISRYGVAITTLTMEYNSQLQVMYVSDPIAPVFLKQYGEQLNKAVLFSVNGVLYMTFGDGDENLENVIFCYDIALKAWWTYTLDIKAPILNMIHVDYDRAREGIGIITEDAVYLLPTTIDEPFNVLPAHEILIESGELTTMQPLQGMHHLSQLEFRFDYFIGEMDIVVTMVDQFGRTITTTKSVHHDTMQHQLSEYLRIDAVVESYKVVLQGPAKMRLTHFLAKLYPKSNRIGMSWGFDSQQNRKSGNPIRRTFTSYNDVKEAIIP